MDTVERIINILNYIALRKEPSKVSEISQQLNITKSSVSRILSSLGKSQWVAQLPSDEYIMGDNMLELSLLVLSNIDLRRIALPYLHELNNTTTETVGLVLRVGYEDIVIDHVQSKNSIQHVLHEGIRSPLCIGATGKVILAHMEPTEIEEYINSLRKLSGFNEANKLAMNINVNKLTDELIEIKRNGYVICIGERTPVTAAIAAPIFQRDRVIASIVVTGPLPRFNEDLARSYSSLLTQTTKKISIRLGSYQEDLLRQKVTLNEMANY